ncbi:MAG: hypothetical protein PHZ19_09255 [Candidatus Thermoplasmatota archaeon]|nr:hypothetical protein [Candidatus Thermoplasmatota archaeon]
MARERAAPAATIGGPGLGLVVTTVGASTTTFAANKLIAAAGGPGIGLAVSVTEILFGGLLAGNLLASSPSPAALVGLGLTAGGAATVVDQLFAGLGVSARANPRSLHARAAASG